MKANRFDRLLRLRTLRERMGEVALVKAKQQLADEEQRARELLERAEVIADQASPTGETNVSDFEFARMLAARAFDGVRAAEVEVKKAAAHVEARQRGLVVLARETDQMEELTAAAKRSAALDAARIERKLVDEISTRRTTRNR